MVSALRRMEPMATGRTMSEGAAATDPVLGRVLGKYRAVKKLGEGGFGAVFQMQHVELPETYQALKVLTLSGVGTAVKPDVVERFVQEARAAAAVGSHR